MRYTRSIFRRAEAHRLDGVMEFAVKRVDAFSSPQSDMQFEVGDRLDEKIVDSRVLCHHDLLHRSVVGQDHGPDGHLVRMTMPRLNNLNAE